MTGLLCKTDNVSYRYYTIRLTPVGRYYQTSLFVTYSFSQSCVICLSPIRIGGLFYWLWSTLSHFFFSRMYVSVCAAQIKGTLSAGVTSRSRKKTLIRLKLLRIYCSISISLYHIPLLFWKQSTPLTYFSLPCRQHFNTFIVHTFSLSYPYLYSLFFVLFLISQNIFY